MLRVGFAALWLLFSFGAAADEVRRETDTCLTIQPSADYVEAMLGADEVRVAYVIGNGAYQGVSALPNPPNDAAAVAERLSALGFKVHLVLDGTDRTIVNCLRETEGDITARSTALLYYAGHGIQVDDENFAIGVNAPADLRGGQGLVGMSTLIEAFRGAKVSLIFLDACRTNPFEGGSREGLAVADARIIPIVAPADLETNAGVQPTGTLITYATSPNATAADGTGRHSPFTKAFLQSVGQPGVSLQQSVSEIGRVVGELTGFTQTPWSRSSLTSFYYLNGTYTEVEAHREAERRLAAGYSHVWQGRRDDAMAVMLSALPHPLERADDETVRMVKSMLLSAAGQDVVRMDIARVENVVYSVDGRRFVTQRVADDGATVVELWDRPSLSLVAELKDAGGVLFMPFMRFSDDSSRFMLETGPTSVSVWSAQDGQLISQLSDVTGGTWDVESVVLSPDGKRLITLSYDGDFLRVYDVDSGKILLALSVADVGYSLEVDTWGGARAVAQFNADGSEIVLALAGADCTYRFARIVIKRPTPIKLSAPTEAFAGKCYLTFVNASSDVDKLLAFATQNGRDDIYTALVFETADGRTIYKREGYATMWRVWPNGEALYRDADHESANPYELHIDSLREDQQWSDDVIYVFHEMPSIVNLAGDFLAGGPGRDGRLWEALPGGDRLFPALLDRLPAEKRELATNDPIRLFPLQAEAGALAPTDR